MTTDDVSEEAEEPPDKTGNIEDGIGEESTVDCIDRKVCNPVKERES